MRTGPNEEEKGAARERARTVGLNFFELKTGLRQVVAEILRQ